MTQANQTPLYTIITKRNGEEIKRIQTPTYLFCGMQAGKPEQPEYVSLMDGSLSFDAVHSGLAVAIYQYALTFLKDPDSLKEKFFILNDFFSKIEGEAIFMLDQLESRGERFITTDAYDIEIKRNDETQFLGKADCFIAINIVQTAQDLYKIEHHSGGANLTGDALILMLAHVMKLLVDNQANAQNLNLEQRIHLVSRIFMNIKERIHNLYFGEVGLINEEPQTEAITH